MTDSDEIKIVVFDVGEGDSILVGFPVNGEMKWGMIDCCERKDQFEPPVLTFIRDNGIQSLEFVCITHFHYDHYRGLPKVLDYFKENGYPIHWFWRYGIVSPTDVLIRMYEYAEELRYMTKSEEMELSITVEEKQFAKERVKELKKILDWRNETAKEMREQGTPFLRRLHGGTMFHRYGRDIAFYCLAPTGDVALEREEYIARAAAGFADILAEDAQHANISSAIVLLTFGKARMLFGGDAGKDIWANSIELLKKSGVVSKGKIDADFVKASHHGSRHSSSGDFWASVLRKNALVTISADQRGNCYGHPHSETLDDIRSVAHQKAVRLRCTNAPPVCIELTERVLGGAENHLSGPVRLAATTVGALPGHAFHVSPVVDGTERSGDIHISVNPNRTPAGIVEDGREEDFHCYYLTATDSQIEEAKRSVLTQMER